MAETNGTTQSQVIEHLNIHGATVDVRDHQVADRPRSLWLSIPAPRAAGDESTVTVFMTVDKLRKLRDDIGALLARIEG